MLLWVEPTIWAFCNWLGNALMTIGLIGLVFSVGHGLISATEYIIDKEENHENQD